MADRLFELVKSLTKPEKRFFNLYTSKYSGTGEFHYIRLFKILDHQKSYNEKDVIKQIYGNKAPSNFSAEKNYLYNLLLNSLNAFYESQSSEGQIRELIRQANVLFRKSLVKDGRQKLSKAKQMAMKHENSILLLEILNIEKESLTRDYFADELQEKTHEISLEEENIFRNITNERSLRELSFRLYDLISKKGRPRNISDLESYRQIMQNPLLINESFSTSSFSRMMFYNMNSTFSYINFEYGNALEMSNKLINLFSEHENLVHNNPIRYAISLRNHLLYNIKTNSVETPGFFTLFESFPSTLSKCPDEVKNYVTQHSYYLNILYAISTKDFTRINELRDGFKQELSQLGNRFEMNMRLTIQNYLSIAYFHMGKYNQALKHNHQVLNDSDIAKRTELYAFAKVFQLVIHLEMNNHELLEYMVKSTYRFLIKRSELYGIEKLTIDFIRRLQNIKSEKQLQSLLLKLLTDFHTLKDDPFEKAIMDYFDFTEWLQNKVNLQPQLS